jgi:hypothetical protein
MTSPFDFLLAEAGHDPREIAEALDSTLRGVDAGLPFTIKRWDSEFKGALFASHVATVTLGVLGYVRCNARNYRSFGMAVCSVSRRLREFGIRIALGAGPRNVLNAAVRKALRLLLVCSVAGLVLGMTVPRLLSSVGYEGSVCDPLVLVGVILAMLMVGLVATGVPALRAFERTLPRHCADNKRMILAQRLCRKFKTLSISNHRGASLS